MKTKYIYPCLMALALASSCVKDQGDEPFTITRKVADKATSDTVPLTIVSDVEGYMYGLAKIDTLLFSECKPVINSNSISDLDCYVTIRSEYNKLDLSRNAVKAAGYVYSHTNSRPVVAGSDCEIFPSKYVVYDADDSTSTDITFTGSCHGLKFNHNYFVRSYVVTTQEDTLYNPRTLKVTTKKPHDVWFQRNPSIMAGRTEAFSSTAGDKTYLYGGKNATTYYDDMWVYDKKLDAWKQIGTFSSANSSYDGHYKGTEKRANGAMFSYINYKKNGKNDTLLYILGGEMEGHTCTKTVAYYNVVNNTFCAIGDHPNYEKQIQIYDNNGYPQYTYDTTWYEEGEGPGKFKDKVTGKTYDLSNPSPKLGDARRRFVADLPYAICGSVAFSVNTSLGRYYYVGLGKTEVGAIIPNIWVYNVDNDCYDGSAVNNPEASLEKNTWGDAGMNADHKTGEGLYQAVAQACDSKIIVGSGESSNGGLSKVFYVMTAKASDGTLNITTLPAVPEEFEPRANAASFYLKYTDKDDMQEYSRFYVGTGRNVLSTNTADYGQSYTLLSDFWCYDFGSQMWKRIADCSNIGREGAIGFSLERNDDYLFNEYGEEIRGFVSFGFGSVNGENPSYRNDNWEYLP